MSVICKKVLVCNRCGCETVVDDTKYIAAANVKLTPEPIDERYRVVNLNQSCIWDSFYLCDKCMNLVKSIIEGEDYILPEMTEKNEKPPEDDRKLLQYVKGPDPDEMEFEEIDLDSEEPKNEPVVDDWDPNNDKKCERIVWDDYIVERIVNLIKLGYTRKMICVKFKLTEPQFSGFLFNVRHPEKMLCDNTKYIRWNKMYGDVLCFGRKQPQMNIDDDLKGEILAEIKAGKKSDEICKKFSICRSTLGKIKREFGVNRKMVPMKERFTPKLVREMFEARKDGMSWNSISQILNIQEGTIHAFTNRLREAQPGDWMYDMAKEYGYVND